MKRLRVRTFGALCFALGIVVGLAVILALVAVIAALYLI